MERTDLEELHQHLQAIALCSAYSGRTGDRAQMDAQLIRERLDRRGFRVGDREILRVEGEPNLPEIVPVPGPASTFPSTGTTPWPGCFVPSWKAT